MGKEIIPVAVYHSPLEGKFGVPRQSGVAADLRGEVRLEGRYRHPDALRGLEGFDYVWLIWGFSLSGGNPDALTVRPPRLGGNTRVGVFASRSPFRPNGLGLSCVKIEGVDAENGVILVSGADLADGTPVYDIKPYVEYADSRPGVRSGFVDECPWEPLEVSVPEEVAAAFAADELSALKQILAADPRPRYQDDPEREYGLTFAGRNVKFMVSGTVVTVTRADIQNEME